MLRSDLGNVEEQSDEPTEQGLMHGHQLSRGSQLVAASPVIRPFHVPIRPDWLMQVPEAPLDPWRRIIDEVALRNGMHRQLTAAYGSAWYDNPKADLSTSTRQRIQTAKDDVTRGGYKLDPPHLVAALTFGFWVSLLGRGGLSGRPGQTKSNYEMTLWRPALSRTFPHARLARAAAHR